VKPARLTCICTCLLHGVQHSAPLPSPRSSWRGLQCECAPFWPGADVLPLCVQLEICREQVEWARTEKRTFLRQRIEARLANLLLQLGDYSSALALIGKLLTEVRCCLGCRQERSHPRPYPALTQCGKLTSTPPHFHCGMTCGGPRGLHTSARLPCSAHRARTDTIEDNA